MLDLLVAEKGITIATAMSAPTIMKVQQKIGAKDMIKIVSFLLKSIIDSIKVTNKPTSNEEIFILASDFIDQYKYESLEDFVLCFKKARKNHFGVIYNRIDSAILFSWMSEHLEEKAAVREREHHQIKYPNSKSVNVSNPKLDEIIKDFNTPKLRSTHKIPVISEDKYNAMLKEQIPFFEMDSISDIKKQALKLNDKKVLKIIEQEIKRRNAT